MNKFTSSINMCVGPELTCFVFFFFFSCPSFLLARLRTATLRHDDEGQVSTLHYNLWTTNVGLSLQCALFQRAFTTKMLSVGLLWGFNPLTPRSNWYLTSPSNIQALSRKQVMRIPKLISHKIEGRINNHIFALGQLGGNQKVCLLYRKMLTLFLELIIHYLSRPFFWISS